MMNHLEDYLRSALRRESPPPGFEERVLRRITQADESAASPAHLQSSDRSTPAPARPGHQEFAWRLWLPRLRPRRVQWLTAAALACLLLVVIAVQSLRYYRAEQARLQAETATRQLTLALTILNQRLNRIEKLLDQQDRGRPVLQPNEHRRRAEEL